MSHSENDKLIDDLIDREVKKPEKKEMSCKKCNGQEEIRCASQEGYNQACDEWKGYVKDLEERLGGVLDQRMEWQDIASKLENNLPNEEEITDLIRNIVCTGENYTRQILIDKLHILVKAIYKRIRRQYES